MQNLAKVGFPEATYRRKTFARFSPIQFCLKNLLLADLPSAFGCGAREPGTLVWGCKRLPWQPPHPRILFGSLRGDFSRLRVVYSCRQSQEQTTCNSTGRSYSAAMQASALAAASSMAAWTSLSSRKTFSSSSLKNFSAQSIHLGWARSGNGRMFSRSSIIGAL